MSKSFSLCKLATIKLNPNIYRSLHTDFKVPDFNDYRRKPDTDPKKSKNTNEDRKAFSYLIVGSEIFQKIAFQNN